MARKTPHQLLIGSAAAAALAAGLAAPAWAGNVVELGYVVDVAGATVLKAYYHASIGPNSFEASLSGKTSGLSNFFSGYKMNQSATGKVVGASFMPGLYENDRKKKGKKAKSTDVTWQSDGAVMVTKADQAQPPPPDVAGALSESTSDPLTAILKMTHAQHEKPCSGKFRVYDGKDVFDLSLSFRKEIALANGGGNGVECKLTWTPVAGKAVADGDTGAETYALSLAPIQLTSGRLMHIPLQIVGKSKGVTVTITAASITVDGRGIDARVSE